MSPRYWSDVPTSKIHGTMHSKETKGINTKLGCNTYPAIDKLCAMARYTVALLID